MRTRKFILNTISSLVLQLTTAICGFILPRLMLGAFGSEVNGAVSSISQFLGYISLLEAGAGGVTRSALYKPLAERDIAAISGIVNAAQGFFQKIAYAFIAYAAVLAFTFKSISRTDLEWTFTASLVVILAASTFAQYYFGVTYAILLQADQRNYVSSTIQIGTVLLNTVISAALLNADCGVHAVKLGSAGVYILRPALLNLFAKRRYHIDPSAAPDNEAVRQRWNGFGHHIAFYVYSNADIFVVTVVLGLKWASVYAVYHMVVSGVKNIVAALTGSCEAAFGNMIAKKEQKTLEERFHLVETISSAAVVIFFTVTGLLLLDFVRIYTRGVADMNYLIMPVGILFTVSEALHCIKQNYHSIVLAAGHYKETQAGAFIEAGLNLSLSFVFSVWLGLPGVLIATIIAACYRIMDYVLHLKTNILEREVRVFFQRQLVNVLNALSIAAVCRLVPFAPPETYADWVMKAIPVFLIACGITCLWNLIFYREDLLYIGWKIKNLLHRAK